MVKDLNRRQFMKRAALLGGGVALSGTIANVLAACGGGGAAPAAPAPAAPAAAPGAAAPAAAPAPAQQPATQMMGKTVTGPIRWLNWSTYDIKEIRNSWEKIYPGVGIELIAINDNEEAFGKIKVAGTGQYDIIGADGLWCQEYYRNGFVEAFDMAEFKTTPELFPEFKSYPPWLVEGGGQIEFPSASSPYMVGYNTKYVKPAPTGFEVFFDPKYKGKVALRDNSNRNFLFTALMLGMKPEELEVDTPEGSRWDIPDDMLKRALDELIKAKPNISNFWRSSGENARAMASEEIWLTFGNVYNALRAADAGNPNIKMVFPSQGTVGWVDGMMIVKDAKNREGAVRWTDHYYSKNEVVKMMQKVWLPICNKEGIDLMVELGHGERIELLQAYKVAEFAAQFSMFRPVKDPKKFNDAWAALLAA